MIVHLLAVDSRHWRFRRQLRADESIFCSPRTAAVSCTPAVAHLLVWMRLFNTHERLWDYAGAHPRCTPGDMNLLLTATCYVPESSYRFELATLGHSDLP